MVSDANERAGVGRQTGSGRALVEVMELGNLRGGDHTPERGRLYRSGPRRVVVTWLMGPHGVVVGDIATQELVQMGLAENDDVIQALAALRTGSARVLLGGVITCRRRTSRVRWSTRGAVSIWT
jgi:hypothetical protein